MKTYKELKKEFEKKVKELRKKCPHKKLSVWMDEYWALGHSTGFQVKSCKICEKIIKKRVRCEKCGEWTEDYIDGDGKKRPWGQFYCKKCDGEVK